MITVARLVSAYKIDVIISWVRVCDVYSYFIRRLTPKVRWVMTQRNSRHADTWLFRLRDFLGQRADAIAANSPGGVQWWRERRTGGSVHLVSNIAAPRHEPGTEQRKQSVLYVGRLEPQKNVETMIKAFALVAQSHPTVSIWVCGDGSLRAQLEQIAVRAGLEDRIEFLGFRQDATEWMARARVVVSLSDHEGMPNVLMEAVQAKCTIVASGIKEHIDFLGPSYPLLVENHHDAEEAAAKIAEGLRTNCSSDHLTHALKRLESMEASEVADSYMQIFQSVALPKTEGCSTSER
ncbi:glycosyltransferase [Mycolicibacterium vaccae]|nr:glycosyltransferase [Mycolicibacterium vaccae]